MRAHTITHSINAWAHRLRTSQLYVYMLQESTARLCACICTYVVGTRGQPRIIHASVRFAHSRWSTRTFASAHTRTLTHIWTHIRAERSFDQITYSHHTLCVSYARTHAEMRFYYCIFEEVAAFDEQDANARARSSACVFEQKNRVCYTNILRIYACTYMYRNVRIWYRAIRNNKIKIARSTETAYAFGRRVVCRRRCSLHYGLIKIHAYMYILLLYKHHIHT